MNLLFRPPLSPEAACHFPPRTESRRGLNCGAEDETASSCRLRGPGDALLLRLTAPCDFVSVAVGDKNGTCSSVVSPNKKFLSRLKENAAPSACCFFYFVFIGLPKVPTNLATAEKKRNRGWFRFSADYIGLIFVSIITVSAVMGKPKD